MFVVLIGKHVHAYIFIYNHFNLTSILFQEMLPIICWDIIVKYAERDASILRSCHKGMNILVDVLNSKLQAHGLEQKNFKEWSYVSFLIT